MLILAMYKLTLVYFAKVSKIIFYANFSAPNKLRSKLGLFGVLKLAKATLFLTLVYLLKIPEMGTFTFFVSQITHVHLLKNVSHVHSRS